jgi:predicted alpha/beta-hydrolase family hydrolase
MHDWSSSIGTNDSVNAGTSFVDSLDVIVVTDADEALKSRAFLSAELIGRPTQTTDLMSTRDEALNQVQTKVASDTGDKYQHDGGYDS